MNLDGHHKYFTIVLKRFHTHRAVCRFICLLEGLSLFHYVEEDGYVYSICEFLRDELL